MKIYPLLVLSLLIAITYCSDPISDLLDMIFKSPLPLRTLTWKLTLPTSNSTLSRDSQILNHFFPSPSGSFNISIVNQKSFLLELTVADGTKSKYTKMLTMDLKFNKSEFPDQDDGREYQHKVENTQISFKVKQANERGIINVDEYKSQAIYNATYISFKGLTLESSQLTLELTITTIDLFDYQSDYRLTGYLHLQVTSLFFIFGFITLIEVIDGSNKEKIFYTFLIVLCVWAKIYMWNTSLGKAGTIFNFLFILEFLLLLAAGLTLVIVGFFLGKSLLNNLLKCGQFLVTCMLFFSVQPLFILLFTIFHIFSLHFEVNQNKIGNVKGIQVGFSICIAVVFHLLKIHLDSVPQPTTIPYDFKQAFWSYNTYKISNVSVGLIYFNALLSIAWEYLEGAIKKYFVLCKNCIQRVQKRKDQFEEEQDLKSAESGSDDAKKAACGTAFNIAS